MHMTEHEQWAREREAKQEARLRAQRRANRKADLASQPWHVRIPGNLLLWLVR